MEIMKSIQTWILGIIGFVIIVALVVQLVPTLAGTTASAAVSTYNYTNSSGGTVTGNTLPLTSTIFAANGIMPYVWAGLLILVIIGLAMGFYKHAGK